MKKEKLIIPVMLVLVAVSLILVSLLDREGGGTAGKLFFGNLLTMLRFLPPALILISLFEVWVEREKVERVMGEKSGAVSYLLAIVLGGLTVGPMIVALPLTAALYRKGARLSVVFTYLGASSVCRIPMTIFESTFLGVKFTLIRYAVSLPLIVLFSWLAGKYLEKRDFTVRED